MDNSNIVDITAGAFMLLFTGAESLGIESTIFELISKFGVVAVLWFWLREMKTQMKEQLSTFDKETTEIRQEHKEQIERMVNIYNDYKDRMDKQVEHLQNQLRQNNPN